MIQLIRKNSKSVTVEVKRANKSLEVGDRIVVKAKKYHRVIPAVIFSPSETELLLEIVDKVEKDTNANIVYKL